MTIKMTDKEKQIERTCVEYVFCLTGGELADKPWTPWVPNTEEPSVFKDQEAGYGESNQYTFTYWYEGPPSYAEDSFEDWTTASYRTVIRCALYGAPKELVIYRGKVWRLVTSYMNSGETTCPLADIEEESSNLRPCPYCEAQEGEDHCCIYLGDGWGEFVYRADDEPEEEEETETSQLSS